MEKKTKELETTIPYFGWLMTAYAEEEDPEQLYVAIKPLCKKMGINEVAQRRKIERDPRFSRCLIASTGADGKKYQMFCIPAHQVGVWLNSINRAKVSTDAKSALIRFQREIEGIIHSFMAGKSFGEGLAKANKAAEEIKAAINNKEPVAYKINGVESEPGTNLAELHLVVNE